MCNLQVPAYAAKGRFHKGGANAGLRAFGIARIVSLSQPAGKKAKDAVRLQWRISCMPESGCEML